MTIRNKTLLLISTTLLGLLLVIYGLSASILTANLKVVEDRDTRENVNRVRDALSQKLSSMNTATVSYSQWSDTKDFLRNKSHEYFEENFSPNAITTLKSNVVVLVSAKNHIVFGTNHDLKTVKSFPLDPQVRAYLTPGSSLLQHVSTRSAHLGILQTSPYPLLVVTRPIVSGTGEGPISGTMLTGVYLTPAEVKNFSELTHLAIDLQRADSKKLPVDFAGARAHLFKAQSIWVSPRSEDTIAGYTLLQDIFGQPALLMRVDARRDIFKQGQLGIRNVVIAQLISGLIFGFVTLFLLEHLVLSRVTRLSREVGVISERSDFSHQVLVEGSDELSGLSLNINSLIGALQASLIKEENDRRAIESSLREKDVLLKEIYHRVKNNLQIISSLLNLQMDAISDPVVREMFDESRNRVRSMGLIHEKLYQSSDLGSIDFGEYLDNLAHSLLRSYSNRAGQISLKLECDAARIDIDLAVPCGLIVNELVTNSLKYAFPDGRCGTITIELQNREAGQLCLQVSDDGIGVPADFNMEEAQSIGMQLVTGLTEQLEGSCELSRDNGTRWIILFKGHNS
ncbi:hypothetical protein B1R32_11048 [Abditibacterium utsteinense]|uniref:histidine kinase n=1 Tax=Abditibacterium utsteinense TaxID=1960156 RepID=A0A2S8SS17_9BACT|nr:histidine kinase dimerization/phosphoacceptor domain -containing protein [Abditibacterium utsteinense]PQV63585.1 hypothetical protein B1R32_11048 [Abditibacterium utsteinense]